MRYFIILVSIGVFACSDSQTAPSEPLDALAPTDVGGADTQDTVELDAGVCVGQPEGSPCDDLDPCTTDDRCSGGLCVGGVSVVCDAEGPCRLGQCDAQTGECQYQDAEDGSTCGVSCFTQATCQQGACKAVAGSEVPCPAPDNPCVDELKCDPSTGACTVEITALEDTDCDTDDDVCTFEKCDGKGACVATGQVDTCDVQAAANPCWTFLCTAAKGCIKNLFIEGGSCNDNNACTSNDSCTLDNFGQKVCLGTPIPIDDANPCTDDACSEGTIVHTPIDGASCPIEHLCSEVGLCDAGECKPTKECACYADSDCAPPEDLCLGQMMCDTTGEEPECVLKPETAVVCPAAADPCMVNTCDGPTGACTLKPAVNGIACDDGNACTQSETCTDGTCGSGLPVGCDDGLFCNGAETCDPQTGCAPGVAPTVDDGIDCTTDACVEGQGVVHTPVDATCADGNLCNGEEVCTLTGCQAGSPPTCDDGDVCNGSELCDEKTGCTAGQPLKCDDGVFCNGAESCDSVTGCQAGTPLETSDGVDCTLDLCSEEDGEIQHLPFDGSCSDGNPCKQGKCDALLGCSTVNLPDGTACPGGAGFSCSVGMCVCAPVCDGSTCGDDGCGGLCACSDGKACIEGVCQGETGTWDGVWTVSANPNTQSLGLLGAASFVPSDITIKVVAGTATGTMNNAGQLINYTGTATESALTLQTSFTDTAGIFHQESWEVTLVDADTFAGIMDEALSVLGLPFNLKWNITGKRK